MYKKTLVCALGLCLVLGCAPKESKVFTSTEADTKFAQVLENDYGYTPILQYAGKTLWAYLPAERDIYKIVGAGIPPTAPKREFTIQFLEGNFESGEFIFEYDIVPMTKALKGNGITTQYTPSFNKEYRNVSNTITRSYLSSEAPPEFIITVFADTINGVEAKSTMHPKDLERYYAGGLPPEEYNMRIINEVIGDKEIVGDKEGKHLKVAEVSWPKFLIDQALQRIRFKFQRSDFPPEETPKSELLKQIALTLLIYDFKDYERVVLRDLRGSSEETFSKAQIEAMKDTVGLPKENPDSKPRIVTIDFSDMWKNQQEDSDSSE
ncbi:MAG: hypothetical protein P9M07_08255 [Candidatus Aceula meridiana]|nr:hypothetical protein [Candidatus Aceula meridiana]